MHPKFEVKVLQTLGNQRISSEIENFFFLIEVQLIYIVLISGIQQRDSVTYMCMCIYVCMYTHI